MAISSASLTDPQRPAPVGQRPRTGQRRNGPTALSTTLMKEENMMDELGPT